MDANAWNDRVDWLKAIRAGWFNEDYIEFLIDKVWKIQKPVNIIDFGCGYGYVGLILLPLLPKGSIYTGVDISENLINDAKSLFDNSGYATAFKIADLNDYKPECKYDIAISQAVLRHIPDAARVLKKMIDSVTGGGLVICMETDLELEKAGQYFDGLDNTEFDLVPFMRKLWKIELANGGRDYRFAIKIPSLMQKMGLEQIGVRMSDSVYFINPYGDNSEHAKQYESFTSAWGWNKLLRDEDRKTFIDSLLARGLNEMEAEAYFKGEQKIREYTADRNNALIIKAPCTLISFGTKKEHSIT